MPGKKRAKAEAGRRSLRLSLSPRLIVQSIEELSAKENLMKSQVRSEIGSRFGKRESLGFGLGPQQGMLPSSQRMAVGPASQRRLFAPRKTFTFHGSRRKTNVSMRTDNLSLGNSLGADASHRRKLTPGPSSPPPAPQPPHGLESAAAADGFVDAAGPRAQSMMTTTTTQQQCAPVADFAVPLVRPQAMLAQHLISGGQLMDGGAAPANEAAGKDAAPWMTERPFSAREAYLGGKRRRARRQRPPKSAAPKPFRKIFFSESEGKWIEHRIFESELKTTHELSGPQPFPKPNAAGRRRRRAAPQLGAPHKVKGRKTSKMREMLPTAFVKGGDQDQPCRKIDVTDQLRIELYKRNMPVVPTSYQQHIYKFGKPPFRGNPRTH